jgi:hypothetical protein
MFLQHRNVSRVALVYGPETAANNRPAYHDSPYNVKQYVLSSRIQLLASIPVSYRLKSEDEIKSLQKLRRKVHDQY